MYAELPVCHSDYSCVVLTESRYGYIVCPIIQDDIDGDFPLHDFGDQMAWKLIKVSLIKIGNNLPGFETNKRDIKVIQEIGIHIFFGETCQGEDNSAKVLQWTVDFLQREGKPHLQVINTSSN